MHIWRAREPLKAESGHGMRCLAQFIRKAAACTPAVQWCSSEFEVGLEAIEILELQLGGKEKNGPPAAFLNGFTFDADEALG